MRKTFVTALIATLVFSGSGSAAVLDGPVINPANGHTYFLLTQNTWTGSETEAEALGGHLATIRNLDENDWIFDTFAGFGGTPRSLWIGLNDPSHDQAGGHPLNFVWVDGESTTYRNWAAGEPNNNGGGQFYTYISVSTSPRAWDDFQDVDAIAPPFGLYGVVEAVPEPGSVGVLVCAAIVIVASRRRVTMVS